MPEIRLSVRDLAVINNTPDVPIVCGNTDYFLVFDFDGNWVGKSIKTVYIITSKNESYTVAMGDGNICALPALRGGMMAYVGVTAGNLRTTRAGVIRVVPSIANIAGVTLPEPPEPDVYNHLMALMERVMDVAGTSRDDAVSAKAEAETARTEAETARDGAELARDGAEAAQTAAQTARDAAARSASLAEQAAEDSGYMFVEAGEDGHLYYCRSDNLGNVDMCDNGNGRLVIEFD